MSLEGRFVRNELECYSNLRKSLRAARIEVVSCADESAIHLIWTILVIAVIALLLNVAVRLVLNQSKFRHIVRPRFEPVHSPSTTMTHTTQYTCGVTKYVPMFSGHNVFYEARLILILSQIVLNFNYPIHYMLNFIIIIRSRTDR